MKYNFLEASPHLSVDVGLIATGVSAAFSAGFSCFTALAGAGSEDAVGDAGVVDVDAGAGLGVGVGATAGAGAGVEAWATAVAVEELTVGVVMGFDC